VGEAGTEVELTKLLVTAACEVLLVETPVPRIPVLSGTVPVMPVPDAAVPGGFETELVLFANGAAAEELVLLEEPVVNGARELELAAVPIGTVPVPEKAVG
jgi:hypothetical protein